MSQNLSMSQQQMKNALRRLDRNANCHCPPDGKTPPRRGKTLLIVLTMFAVVAGAAFVGWMMFGGKKKTGPGPLVNFVTSGPYDFMVLEQGEVESSSNVELRCEVKSRTGGGGAGITILEVVPEGTQVNAGDLLVKLDSSSLDQERVQQQITVNNTQALVVQATNTLEAAKIARKEYLEGTFKQEEKVIMGEVFVAEQGLRTAQLALESSQRLAAKGLLAPLQLEGAQFAVDNARNQLEAAKSKLEVLRKYTREKFLKQFDSDIATAEAKVRADESSYKLELEKLKDVEDQVVKCIIRAPQPGQVVYANRYSSSSRSGSSAEFVVEAGSTVREQQPIIRLPDSNKMQIKALVNEARITLVKPGLPVSIRIDALKDEIIQGEVTKVNQYAEPGGWSSGNIKKYATYIRILNPPPLLRSGMNSEVRIHVERLPDALQVPVQALAEHKGHFFCLVKNGESYETREVKVSSTNDKMAVIETGLAAKEQVVMNPRGQADRLVLPDLPDPTPVQIAAIARATGVPAITPAGLTSALPGAPGGNAPEGKKRGNMTAGMLVERALESDADKDGKLSKEEIAQMDERRQSMVATADSNTDGFVDRSELTIAAAASFKRMQEARKAGGGPGGEGGPGGGPATGGGQ